MPFAKGQSGNPGGRSRERPWKDAIKRAVDRAGREGMKAIDDLADALIKAAKDGDVPALREIGDRLDGKVPQALIGGDEDDPPINHNMTVEFVRPKPAESADAGDAG